MAISFSTRPHDIPGSAPLLVMTGSETGNVRVNLSNGVATASLNGAPLTVPTTLVSGIDASALTGAVVELVDDGRSDLLIGTGGDDTLRGGAGDDVLQGAAGDDVLYPGSGADTVDGGVGLDIVVIDADVGDLIFTETDSGYTIRSAIAGQTDVTELRNVELVVTRDQVVTFEGPNLSPAIFGVAVFDESDYLARYPDVAAAVASDAVQSGYVHYITAGYAEGRLPAAGFVDTAPPFSEARYLAANPDVAAAVAAGTYDSGLSHFLAYGYREAGRLDNQLYEARDAVTVAYSEDFYLNAYPDVAAAVANGAFASGLAHYTQMGRAEGRLTYPPALGQPEGLNGYGFDELFYLATNLDVADAIEAGLYRTGYEHFFIHGLAEGRSPNPYFDSDWYGDHNPDVVAAVARGEFNSLLEHFVRFGWQEDRDPSAVFDISAYLQSHPDVAAAGINPVIHYLQSGWGEGRVLTPAADFF